MTHDSAEGESDAESRTPSASRGAWTCGPGEAFGVRRSASLSISRTAGANQSPGLHRFAVLTAFATLALIGLGGLVTSHGVGMAVPDWPTTYGYNMFFFPVSQWIGGIFYEHTHRLLASAVGVLTSILALWLYGRSARRFMRWTGSVLLVAVGTLFTLPGRWADAAVAGATGLVLFAASFTWPRREPGAKWLRRLGLAAFLAVVLQGVLGGLRVVLFKDQIGIFHAALAQIFFVMLCAIALFTSRWWSVRGATEKGPSPLDTRHSSRAPGPLPYFFLGITISILGQLILGATMRHQHAGLAIPDFPLAYGKIWPPTDAASVMQYNQKRVEITAANPITAFQIELQMVHRIVAILILAAVAACAAWTRRKLGQRNLLSNLALVWLGLILAQVVLGAATIWTNKAADIATLHVLVGALSLVLGSLLSIIALGAPVPAPARASSAAAPDDLSALQPARLRR